MNKPKKNSLLDVALNYLVETSENLLDLSYKIIFDPEELIKIGSYSNNLSPSPTIWKNIYKLKHSSYFKNVNGKLYLTKKGRLEIIKKLIKNKKEKEKWDGKWRAIIFDIPELKRNERSFLRKELRMMGFQEMQQSIWVFPFNIEQEIFALLKLWKKDFAGDIRFLRIEKVEDDKDIKKIFNL